MILISSDYIYDLYNDLFLYIGSKIYIEKIFSKKYPNNIFDWLQGENRNLHKISWEKKSNLVGGKYREASGEHRGTMQNPGDLKCWPQMLSGWTLSEDPDMPIRRSWNASSPIWMWDIPRRKAIRINSIRIPPGGRSYVARGDRLRVQGVGTPLPDDTERARLSRFPKRKGGAMLSDATPSGR